MAPGGGKNLLFHFIRQILFFTLQDVGNVLIVNLHVVLGADLADHLVVHGDNASLQRPAELQVWLAVLQEQHVRGIAADVDDKEPGGVQHHAALGHYCRESLGEHHHLSNKSRVRFVPITETHWRTTLEIVCELLFQPAVVLGWQAHCQLDVLIGRILALALQLLGYGEQSQDKETLVLGLITYIRQSLAGKCPEPAAVFQNLVGHGRLDRVLGQTGHKGEPGRLDGVVAMVDSD